MLFMLFLTTIMSKYTQSLSRQAQQERERKSRPVGEMRKVDNERTILFLTFFWGDDLRRSIRQLHTTKQRGETRVSYSKYCKIQQC